MPAKDRVEATRIIIRLCVAGRPGSRGNDFLRFHLQDELGASRGGCGNNFLARHY
jgi:hypothetical protein